MKMRYIKPQSRKPSIATLQRLSVSKCNGAGSRRGSDCSLFPVPPSWQVRASGQAKLRKHSSINILDDPSKQQQQKETNVSSEEEGSTTTFEQKLNILKEQEGYVSPQMKAQDVKQDEIRLGQQRGCDRGISEWIKSSLVTTPLIGRTEGHRKSFSSIGQRLNTKSQKLKLWHEEASQADGRRAKVLLLHCIPTLRTSGLTLSLDHLELRKPISQLLRVPVPYHFRASPRVDQEDQKKQSKKGGSNSGREQLAIDYKLLVESLRRQRDCSLEGEEARLLLCKGILHDNAQVQKSEPAIQLSEFLLSINPEYAKGLKCYKDYLELCKRNGDENGETMAYNFMGCSLQEEQDLKLSKDKTRNTTMIEAELSTSATIQYEKAEEYHKMHAKLSDYEGKFIAYTNLGLLSSTLSRWAEAAVYHQKALKCATLIQRLEDQGVAVGNLGFLLFARKKWKSAKSCMIRYLQICYALKDIQGEARAHYILGSIASQLKRHEESLKELRAAVKAARSIGDKELERVALIMMGVANGNVHYAEAFKNFQMI